MVIQTHTPQDIKVAEDLLKKWDFFLNALQENLCEVSPTLSAKVTKTSQSLRNALEHYRKDPSQKESFRKELQNSVDLFESIFSEQSNAFLPLQQTPKKSRKRGFFLLFSTP